MPRIVLWNPPAHRPAYRLMEVYCDLCNKHVPLNPAPMVGSYVLCLDCLEKVEPGWRKQITPLLETIWRDQMASE